MKQGMSRYTSGHLISIPITKARIKYPLICLKMEVTSLVSLPFISKIPNELYNPLYLFIYLFCNMIMTGEPAHTTSKERIVPGIIITKLSLHLNMCPNYQF